MRSTEELKQWVEIKIKKNPNEKIDLTARELFDLLSSVCEEQMKIDVRAFKEEMEAIIESQPTIRKVHFKA